MRLPIKRRLALQRLGLALLSVAVAALLAVPASAQYWGDRPGYYQQGPSGDYPPFFGGGGSGGGSFIRPPVIDSTKAPGPRKLETPPSTTVVVIGDSTADWLGYGLDETYSDQPDVGVERKIRAASGLIRYDSKNETLDWPGTIKDALATEKPNAIVVMLGLNDRVSLRDRTPPPPPPPRSGPQKNAEPPVPQAAQISPPAAPSAATDTEAPPPDGAAAKDAPVPGGSYEFRTDQWAAIYSKRIDEMIAVLKSKGVPVLWVGLPAIRGAKSTADLAYLDELYRERAEKAGIIYVDIWDGFVDDQGRYVVEGPDFEGQTRRLRTGDGVHFTKAGAMKLASYVDLELRRVMLNHVLPVALPGPEEKPAVKPGAPRPDIGPVLPLTTSGGDTSGLLGAGSNPAPIPDPVAAKVLSRGDPIAAPTGRADDFSWPRAANDNDATVTPLAITSDPAALAPGSAGKKSTAGNNGKKDAKPTADLGSARSIRAPSGGY
jgi:lysophospholipase L1-like esterase